MVIFTYQNHEYELDDNEFLIRFEQWDRKFAEGMAKKIGIRGGLVKEHWDVINTIRESYITNGRCPLVYEICRLCGLRLKELKMLFPEGYFRGACKLAGLSNRENLNGQTGLPKIVEDFDIISTNKCYMVDVRGFLIDPSEWDEYFAVFRAYDMKIPGGNLTDKHWLIINYVREYYMEFGVVPTIYKTCNDNLIDLAELERLFPDGYHRGVVKMAGLRLK